MPFVLSCEIAHLIQHILNKYAVSGGRIVDQHVGDGTDELAVLHDGRAAHECGQERTTKFTKKCFRDASFFLRSARKIFVFPCR